MQHYQEYNRVYVWELPIRLFHWINFVCMVLLVSTGLIIGNPPALMSGAEASNQYWFGITRFIHFSTAYIFTFNLLYRFIWGFFGNKYARWKSFWPFTKERWHNLVCVLRVDLLLRKPVDVNRSHMAVGHNQLAYVSYFFFFLLCIVQIGTGFALYADNAAWWFPSLFTWVKDALGGDMTTRLVHHFITWIMIVFTVIHLYLVFYHDWLEGRGIVSSIFGGYKFIKRERLKDTK